LAQHPVRTQFAWLARQFSTHCLACAGVPLFMQFVTQVLFSPLHFIGSADAICALKRNSVAAAMALIVIVVPVSWWRFILLWRRIS
jgi:hypothetical protein